MKKVIFVTMIAVTACIIWSFFYTDSRLSVMDQIHAFGRAPLTAIEQEAVR
jgi:hypothetical protein